MRVFGSNCAARGFPSPRGAAGTVSFSGKLPPRAGGSGCHFRAFSR